MILNILQFIGQTPTNSNKEWPSPECQHCRAWEDLELIYIKWLESHVEKVKHIKCYGLNHVPQNVSSEAPAPVPQTDLVFRAKVFKEAIKLKSLEWALIQYDQRNLKTKRGARVTCSLEKRSGEGAVRRWPSASHKERPQKKPFLLTSWSWTSSIYNCE